MVTRHALKPRDERIRAQTVDLWPGVDNLLADLLTVRAKAISLAQPSR